MNQESLRIGISGARGSGKSALARMLANSLRADILSLGRLRSAVRYDTKDDKIKESVNEAESAEIRWDRLNEQATRLYGYVASVIDECRKREARLVVEGAHVVPGLYSLTELQVQVVLRVSGETLMHRYDKDKVRLSGKALTDDAFERAIRNYELQERLLEAAAATEAVHVIDAKYLPAAFVQIIQLIPKDLIPSSQSDD